MYLLNNQLASMVLHYNPRLLVIRECVSTLFIGLIDITIMAVERIKTHDNISLFLSAGLTTVLTCHQEHNIRGDLLQTRSTLYPF